MTVYVDDMAAAYGKMKMYHLLADTDAELHAMVDKIGVQRKWWQAPTRTAGSHYDICQTKRLLAIQGGAIQVTWRQASAMNARRRITGELGKPGEAIAWFKAHKSANVEGCL